MTQDAQDDETHRVCSCGARRPVASYTIEDLDAIETVSATEKLLRICSCEQPGAGRQVADLRKHRSIDTRWPGSFLSPDDAIWDLRKHASEDTEYRWALHTSRTDIDLARSAKSKCSCHSLTPEEKRPERGDLRKHHSAETDKWSLRPDDNSHDLRKHNSDDTRMAREARWTLQVPDALPNPKPRCGCPKKKASPVDDDARIVKKEPERKIVHSGSLNAEESKSLPVERPELKKHASEDSKWEKAKEKKSSREASSKNREKEQIRSPANDRKAARSKWAVKTHFSLPAEKKETRWQKGQAPSYEPKSKSLKERYKSSTRQKSLSPEPESTNLLLKPNDKIVKRLISPEITITDAKWAPYQGHSPLPNVGIKKREQKRISEIKWTPYDDSPTMDILHPDDQSDTQTWSPFRHVTPTSFPPPKPTPCREEEVEDESEETRWRLLNMISPFPIYQGAWRDETPPETPERPATKFMSQDLSTPVWSPQERTPIKRYSPPPPQPVKSRSIISRMRKDSRTKSELRESEAPPEPRRRVITTRASSEETRGRQRPQLVRSKALLEVPGIDATKRSLSEEVPRHRVRESHRKPHRARSEEGPKYSKPWFAESLSDTNEMCQYVTTV